MKKTIKILPNEFNPLNQMSTNCCWALSTTQIMNHALSKELKRPVRLSLESIYLRGIYLWSWNILFNKEFFTPKEIENVEYKFSFKNYKSYFKNKILGYHKIFKKTVTGGGNLDIYNKILFQEPIYEEKHFKLKINIFEKNNHKKIIKKINEIVDFYRYKDEAEKEKGIKKINTFLNSLIKKKSKKFNQGKLASKIFYEKIEKNCLYIDDSIPQSAKMQQDGNWTLKPFLSLDFSLFAKIVLSIMDLALFLKGKMGKELYTPRSSRIAMENELNKGNILLCSYLSNIKYFKSNKAPKFKQTFSRHQAIVIDHDRDYFYIQDSYEENGTFIRKIHKKNLFHIFYECRSYNPN